MSLDIEVSCSLNGETINVTIEEDTTGDSTVDNSETVTLQDGTNTYSLSSIDGSSGNQIRAVIDLSTSDETVSPQLNSVGSTGVAGITVSYWDGSQFVSAPLKVWDGTAWIDPSSLSTADSNLNWVTQS